MPAPSTSPTTDDHCGARAEIALQRTRKPHSKNPILSSIAHVGLQ